MASSQRSPVVRVVASRGSAVGEAEKDTHGITVIIAIDGGHATYIPNSIEGIRMLGTLMVVTATDENCTRVIADPSAIPQIAQLLGGHIAHVCREAIQGLTAISGDSAYEAADVALTLALTNELSDGITAGFVAYAGTAEHAATSLGTR